MKEKYKKENLEPIVIKSKTLTECLNLLNIRSAGGNYETLKKYIKLHFISTSHFINDEEKIRGILEYNKLNKKSFEEILVSGSTYNRSHLKNRLIKENILNYKCEKCNNVGEWNDEKLVLQLDHKNGIHNDNRLENLRFLCPNCHSQTDTFAGKRHKIDKPFGHGEKWKECNINRRRVERPSYDELLNEVNKHGYSATGRKFGVSDNSIRKWIKNYVLNGY